MVSVKEYYNEVIGHNSRLDEFQAAVLLVKLAQLPALTAQLQEAARLYAQHLAGIADLQLLVVASATYVYHPYVVRSACRDALKQHLSQAGIGALVHYPVPPHRQQAYAHLNIPAGAYPIAEELAATSLSLPMWPGMKEHVAVVVGEAVQKFFQA